MKLLKVVFCVFLFSSCVAQTSQDGVQKHVVAKGETVYQIAKQYQTEMSLIISTTFSAQRK